MASPGSVVIQFQAQADQAAREVAGFAKKLLGLDSTAKDTDRALDQVQAGIDQTGNMATASATDLGRIDTALASVGTEAEQTAAKLRVEAGNMAGAIRTGTVGVAADLDGMRANMGEVGRESGAEFVGNIAEGIGSGQANLTDVVSGTLGGLTNLAATMTGPVGLAAAGAAAGIGLVFQAVRGEAEQAKAKIDGLRGALDGLADLASEEAEQLIFQTWIEDAQKTTGKIDKVRDALKTAGVTAEEFQSALAGDPQAIENVRRKLQLAGGDIIKNQQQTGKLTDEQQRYLDTFPTILKDIHANDAALGVVRREHDAINDLLGKTPGLQGKVTKETEKTKGAVSGVKDEIDRIPNNKTVTVTVKYRDENGKPVNPSDVGRSAAGAAPAATRAAPVTINYYAGQGGDARRDARILKRILEGEDLRQGRPRGEPLAVAW